MIAELRVDVKLGVVQERNLRYDVRLRTADTPPSMSSRSKFEWHVVDRASAAQDETFT